MTGMVGPRRPVHLLPAPLAAERPLCPRETISTIFFPTIHLHGKPHRFLYRSVRLHNSLTCMGNRTDFCIDLFAFTIRSPAWETAPTSVSICSPSQFAHLHGKPPVSVRVITTSVSLTAERPFRLQGTHVIPILFGSQFTIDVRLHDPHRFFGGGPKLERNRTWETSIALFLYLPPSIGLLLTVRSRFFFAAERRCTRAIFERHHARAASEFTGWRSSLPFFFYVIWSCMVCTIPPLYKRPHLKQYCTTTTPLASKQYSTYTVTIASFFPACLAKHPFCVRFAFPTRYAFKLLGYIYTIPTIYIFLCGIYSIRISMVTCCDYIYIFMRGYLHHERYGTANFWAKPERCKDKDYRH